MNFDFADLINPLLEQQDFIGAINLSETEMRKIPQTKYHEILEESIINPVSELALWIEDFYQSAKEKKSTETFYFEVNGFVINPDKWYIDGFAYEKDGGLNLIDIAHMDWLCDNFDVRQAPFVIKGLGRLQEVYFEESMLHEESMMEDALQNASDWCEQLIVVKFLQFMCKAHLLAKEKSYECACIPIYFSVHDYEIIIRSVN